MDEGQDVDQWAVSHDYVSITPIQYDLTDHSMIDELEQWGLKSSASKRKNN